MGSPLGDFGEAESLSLDDLRGKRVAIDGNLEFFQYASVITDEYGDAIRNDEGEPINTVIGLSQRITALLKAGVRPIYVFDGGYPDLKEETVESRRSPPDARANFREAKANGDTAAAKHYARKFTDVGWEAGEAFLDACGIPVVHAPMEGEPQCVQLVHDGMADYPASQDFDTMLYGSDHVLRNLRNSGADRISLASVLATRDWSLDQLRWYAVLRGSDYNSSPYGVGPVRGKHIVDDAASFDDVLDTAAEWDDIDRDRWRQALRLFEEPTVAINVDIEFGSFDRDVVYEVACERYGLSDWRVQNTMKNVPEGPIIDG